MRIRLGVFTLAALAVFSTLLGAGALPNDLTTFAGGFTGDGGQARNAIVKDPYQMTYDPSGNLYIVDEDDSRVRRVTPGGTITTFAGTGIAGFSGDGGPAAQAQLNRPVGIVALGDAIYIADRGNNRIRRVQGSTIDTFGGTGQPGFAGDGGSVSSAMFSGLGFLASGPDGALYVSDEFNNRVRRIADGAIMTVAGDGTYTSGGDGGPATAAAVQCPAGLAFDATGSLYVAQWCANRIRKISPDGIISTIAGTGAFGWGGDSPAVSTPLASPYGLAFLSSGALLVADSASHRIRSISASGFITTVAGTTASGYAGDNGGALTARMSYPRAVITRPGGMSYAIADALNARVRAVTDTGFILTIAGRGRWAGDGGPASASSLYGPFGVSTDEDGNVYIADTFNARVRKVTVNGVISTIAGTGKTGTGPDNVQATSSDLAWPWGVAVDDDGNVFVAERASHRVRKISPSGIITTVAGNGAGGFTGDGGKATSARLSQPTAVAVAGDGTVYIADHDNQRVRRVDPAGTITTIAGTGVAGYSGDDGPSAAAQINSPNGITVHSSGHVYIADTGNCRVRVIEAGMIRTAVGTGQCGYAGDGGPAASARIAGPISVAFDALGRLYIGEGGRVRRVGLLGDISTIAGNGGAWSGDGSPATGRGIGWASIAVDTIGNLYIADFFDDRVFRVDLPLP